MIKNYLGILHITSNPSTAHTHGMIYISNTQDSYLVVWNIVTSIFPGWLWAEPRRTQIFQRLCGFKDPAGIGRRPATIWGVQFFSVKYKLRSCILEDESLIQNYHQWYREPHPYACGNNEINKWNLKLTFTNLHLRLRSPVRIDRWLLLFIAGSMSNRYRVPITIINLTGFEYRVATLLWSTIPPRLEISRWVVLSEQVPFLCW